MPIPPVFAPPLHHAFAPPAGTAFRVSHPLQAQTVNVDRMTGRPLDTLANALLDCTSEAP